MLRVEVKTGGKSKLSQVVEVNNLTFLEGQHETLSYCRCHITTYRHLLKANYSRLDKNTQQPSQQDKRVIHDEYLNLKKIHPRPNHIPQNQGGREKRTRNLKSPMPSRATVGDPHSPTHYILLSFLLESA